MLTFGDIEIEKNRFYHFRSYDKVKWMYFFFFN